MKQIVPKVSRRAQRSGTLRKQAGAALVEYAFVGMIFLTLIFGIGAFGHALFAYHFVNEVAKEATRYAAVRGANCANDSSCAASNSASGVAGPTSQSDVTAFVKSLAPQSIDPSKLTVTATWPGPASPQICTSAVNGVGPWPSNSPGCTVQVQVQYTYTMIFPLISNSPINLASTSEMLIAN
jgi:Flp pilus assembly protein TadG